MVQNRAELLILGGGQLGRMLGQAAARLDVDLTVLDPTPDCPAASTARRHITANFADADAVLAAGSGSSVVTVEIEHVATGALRELARSGVAVRPSADTLETVNDKLAQRRALSRAGVPGPRFAAPPEEDAAAEPNGAAPPAAGSGDHGPATAEALSELGLPAVQKLRFGGYDGRGVAVVRASAGAAPLVLPLDGPSYFEELVDIETELAVLVARTPGGEMITYPPVEMEMDPELNLVRAVLYPASVASGVAGEADRVARAAAEAIGAVGITAVELFVTTDGAVLVNELAPRPHNSGHLTIEAAETDQFEQHLRAVLELPLGSTRMRGPAVMRNIIGSGTEGPTVYEGLGTVLAIPGAHLHLYGKRQSRPGRKMGHLTVCRETIDEARAAAAQAVAALRVSGADPAAGAAPAASAHPTAPGEGG